MFYFEVIMCNVSLSFSQAERKSDAKVTHRSRPVIAASYYGFEDCIVLCLCSAGLTLQDMREADRLTQP